MIEVTNTKECFVRLWRMLEPTRQHLSSHYKRFCIRNVLKAWFGEEATDSFIFQVCQKTVVGGDFIAGWDELPLPALYPRSHRELLRAVVAVRLGIGTGKVDHRALDAAYSVAFPHSTPINVNRKGCVRP